MLPHIEPKYSLQLHDIIEGSPEMIEGKLKLTNMISSLNNLLKPVQFDLYLM